MTRPKLPTIKQIREWAKIKGWTITTSIAWNHLRYYKLIRRVIVEGSTVLYLETADDYSNDFKRASAILMDEDGYKWRMS